MRGQAATQWMKYDASILALPQLGEWCLWTMELGGKRNYFGGALFESGGRLLLGWDGLGNFEPDDSLYFARVLPVKVDELCA